MDDNDPVSVSSTPPPRRAFRLHWDVFLSFTSEEDTRHSTFTTNLYSSLQNHGVRVFRHDNAFGRDDVVVEAIEDSAASIVIMSPNYASSQWCLEELSKVDPEDVRRQRGAFEEHFRNHEERFGKDKVMRWRRAMEKAGETPSWVFNNSEEAQLVQALVTRVFIELSNTPVVRDMGRQIVRENSLVDPGMRTRLWDRDEIMTVLKDMKGTQCIEGIVLDFEKRNIVKHPSGDKISWVNFRRKPNFTSAVTYLKERYKSYLEGRAEKEREVIICTKSFKNMVNLRLLQINNVNLEGEFKYLPVELKWLQWKGCPMKTLPSDFCPRKVVVLDLSVSKIEHLWCSNNYKVLENLKVLNLHGCYNLTVIPDLSGHQALEKLDLERCGLPQFIGKLCSLKELSLNHSALEEIPDSIGSLANLEELSLKCCRSLTRIPDSIGNLKSLTNFFINGTKIKELPWSIGSLSNLKHLLIGENYFLSKLPDSIGGLASIVELNIEGTSMTNLPDQIGALKVLKKLEIRKCESLISLPESIGSMLTLTTLIIFQANISELPESIGMLENLIVLRLDKCKQLYKLPSSIGKLKSLQRLLMEETAVTDLPESFGMLSSVMIIKMAKNPHVELLENSTPEDAVIHNTKEKSKLIDFPTSFLNLSRLCEFNICGWQISGKIPDDFEKLSTLEILNLGHNHFCSLPSSLRGLSILKKLILSHCKELKTLPPLPSSLQEVNVSNCIALESFSDLSNLENLCDLNLTNCEKLVDIPGLKCLESLRRLYMSGCNACSSVVKRRLAKAPLRNFRNISMPGSKIPDFFSQKEVRFKDFKNRQIKGVIIGVVFSVNHQISEDFRHPLPAAAIGDIEASILKLDFPIFKTSLHLMGVPKTNDNQIHLCQYPNCHPLVSSLKDGYKIHVTKRNPPFMKGVELKNWGIYMVFDGDDDYEGDKESLNQRQKSIPERLAKFFSDL
ncbi:hypothetical protein CMV_003342 [Castanea mollissima]|uniref:TIR domain-containing protein n=1 Tax=Castanea mollissima TaxID=60419 RepID=A0A8J4RTI9_9ROSI|nr:hypothetical protein CMV_003342 [Castanea mollissima]